MNKITENGKYCKKVSFATQEYADAYITKLQKTSQREKVPVASYLCTKCNCWHLTSWQQPDIDKLMREVNNENRKHQAEMATARKFCCDALMLANSLKIQNIAIQSKIERLTNQLNEVKCHLSVKKETTIKTSK